MHSWFTSEGISGTTKKRLKIAQDAAEDFKKCKILWELSLVIGKLSDNIKGCDLSDHS